MNADRAPLVSAVLTAACCAAAGGAALWGAGASWCALLLAAAFVPYAGVLAGPAPPKHFAERAALLAGLVLCVAPPVLSDDVYRYLWDGRVLGAGINPYAYAPDHPELAPLRDALWARINHASIPTIYPPLAQVWFALGRALWEGPTLLKLMALSAHLGTARVVPRLAQAAGAPAAQAERSHAWYVLNPLALSESAFSGHVDAPAGLCLALGVLMLCRSRPARATAWLAAATGLKVVGLLLAPLTGWRLRRWLPLALAACAVVVVPQLLARGDAGGLGHYARRWQGNSALFPVLQAAVEHQLRVRAEGEYLERGHILLEDWRQPLAALEGTPIDPWAGAVAEKKEVPDRADFEITFLASQIARLVAATLIGLVALGLVWWRVPPLIAARWLLFAALWLVPQVHPWYLLWLLPLECAAGRYAGLVWSATALVAYAPLDLWQSARIWRESAVAHVFEFGLVALVLVSEPWLLMGARAAPPPTPAPSGRGAVRGSDP